MRTIDCSSAFKRDYKREAKGRYRATLDDTLKPALLALAADQPLDARYRDHDLSGDWAGYRECHLKPDLLRSTGNRIRTRCDSHGWARTANFSVACIRTDHLKFVRP